MVKNNDKKELPFQLYDSTIKFQDELNGCVVAVGNFDGMHRGHKNVLETALLEAKRRRTHAVAVTFEPHPRTVFRPEHPVFRLTQADAKAEIIEALGFDGMLVLRFDKAFADISAESFVNDLLVKKLGISHIVVGYDFHFGKDRAGNSSFLEESSKNHDFGVTIVDPFEDDQSEVVSSSRIREALSAGDIVFANALLGYRWFLHETVQHGEKRGRTLGFPTANLHIPEEYRLQLGIYAVQVFHKGKRYDAVASYGRRPTFDNSVPILEVFIFEFSEEIYDESIKVVFCSYLRPELKFDDVNSLVDQMHQDTHDAKMILASLHPLSDLDLLLNSE